MTASISGDPRVWVAEGWAERFALRFDLPMRPRGGADSPEQVAAFRVVGPCCSGT